MFAARVAELPYLVVAPPLDGGADDDAGAGVAAAADGVVVVVAADDAQGGGGADDEDVDDCDIGSYRIGSSVGERIRLSGANLIPVESAGLVLCWLRWRRPHSVAAMCQRAGGDVVVAAAAADLLLALVLLVCSLLRRLRRPPQVPDAEVNCRLRRTRAHCPLDDGPNSTDWR